MGAQLIGPRDGRGLYIAVDGPDGVGKSTFVAFAAEQLKAFVTSVIVVAEPERHAPLWPAIKDHRLSGIYPDEIWAITLAAASLGTQTRRGGLLDHILTGAWVVTDRSPLSLVALYLCTVDRGLLEALVARFRPPDVLLLLQPENLELLCKRLRARGQSEIEIAEDVSAWQNYRVAGDWLSGMGWNVQPLLVRADAPVESLWRRAQAHLPAP